MIWKEERMKEEIVVRYKFVIEIKVWNYDKKRNVGDIVWELIYWENK